MMRTRAILIWLAAPVAALAVACGGGGSSPAVTTQPAAAATQAPAATSAGGATVSAATAPAATAPASSSPAAAAGTLPANICALLTDAEAQQYAAGAGAGVPNHVTTAVTTTETCLWSTTTGGVPLSASVGVSTLPAGVTVDSLRTTFAADAQRLGANAAQISGLGDAAVYTSTIPGIAEVKVATRGLLLTVRFTGRDARTKKDLAITFARTAAGRM